VTTLNQIFELIETFGANHSQVRTVIFGDGADVNNSSPQNGMVLRYFPDPSSQFAARKTIYGIVVELMDQVLDEDSNMKDVVNDTHLVALDLIAYLNFYGNGQSDGPQTYEFTLEMDNIQLFPFFDQYESRYFGHSLMLRFNLPFDLDKCSIPLN
jgi:hypothetical protein